MAAIEVDDLTKRYRDVTAVDHLGFEVEAGSITGFIGPNGAGKTTTLRILLGLVRPTGGDVRIDGRRYSELRSPATHVGAVLEPDRLHPAQSARNLLRTVARGAGIVDRRVTELLDEVGLGDAGHRRVGSFSLGMRQRLGLAAAMLGNPPILVLDEPANGLDPAGIRWLRDYLRDFAADGRTVLVSSHVLAELARVIDHAVIINHGRLVAACSLDELARRSGSIVEVRASAASELARVLAQQGHEVDRSLPGTLRVTATPEIVRAAAGRAGIGIEEIVASSSNLEDVVLNLIAEHQPPLPVRS